MNRYVVKNFSGASDSSAQIVEAWINENKVEGVSLAYNTYTNMLMVGGYVKKVKKKEKKEKK
jgi:hypothetical protein